MWPADWIVIGDHQPRTIPTKDLLHEVVFFGGVVRELSEPKKRQKIGTHPQFCTRDVDRRFCGSGTWISRSGL